MPYRSLVMSAENGTICITTLGSKSSKIGVSLAIILLDDQL